MDPGPPPTSMGRGSGSGHQGGRGTSRGGRGGRRNNIPTISKHRFDGATEELKGQIFNLVGARSADLFINQVQKSTRELRWANLPALRRHTPGHRNT